MKAVDFYKLPRAIQDRFVGSVMSGFPPAPLASYKAGTPLKLMWLGLTAACFVLLIVVTRLGYGSLDSALSLHSVAAVLLYVGLVFGLGFGLVQAYGRLVREKALPYSSGVYLFPACVIDARNDQFKVYDTKDLASVDLQGSSLRVAFAGGATFMFPISNAASAPALVTEVNAARDRAMHAHATDDPKELVAVDPLHNPRFSSPVGPRDSYALKLPPWGKLGVAVALGLGVTLGPVIWLLRNSGSDKTMYARATQANDVESYKAYLKRGERYKDQVANVLLPRAELQQAIRQNTVEALLDFKAKHPATRIGGEVQIALRSAMLAELEKAKAQGTLAALDEFAKKYPEHGVEPELRDAIHAVYMRELDAYRKKTPNKDKNVLPFVERLFAWSEKHGPKVEVRFRHKKSDSMGRADQHVGKTPSFMGEVSYPSKYFDDKRTLKREQVLGKTLAARLDAGLSPELFDIDVGAPVPGDVDPLPDVKVPTLFVTHTEEWSGHGFTANRPRGSYVGFIYVMEAVFVIPGDKQPVKLRTEQFKPPPLQVLKDDDQPMLPPGQAEEKVYEHMNETAFETFAEKLLGLFLPKPDKPASP
jgi:hypothetical protein